MADQGNITTPDAGDLNTAARKYAASQGWAMPDGSYPIRPADMHGGTDLGKAIQAVGRGGASHDAIRRHIIKRARALGMSDRIPDNWAADGTMKGNNAMSSDVERRFTSVPVEIRVAEKMTIGGYAAKFDRMSQNIGGFVERIDPGFFDKSRGDGWPGVLARYNHDDNMLLGTSGSGTLRLGVDRVGLDYQVDVPAARADVYELVQRGDLRQSSFAFIAYEDDWATSDQGFPLRTLLSGRLMDVAPVNTPAYEDTTVGLRSLAERFSAPLEEVRQLAAANQLGRFFTRTDTTPATPPRRSSQAALAKVLGLG
jgi:HK97 family phage prohead protease